MRPEKLHFLIIFVLIGTVLPFGTWALLLIVAKVRNLDLRPTLRWLCIARWVGWFVGAVLMTVALVTNRMWHSWYFPIGMSLAVFSSGLSFPEGWVKRHYAPRLNGPDSEYWPTARN